MGLAVPPVSLLCHRCARPLGSLEGHPLGVGSHHCKLQHELPTPLPAETDVDQEAGAPSSAALQGPCFEVPSSQGCRAELGPGTGGRAQPPVTYCKRKDKVNVDRGSAPHSCFLESIWLSQVCGAWPAGPTPALEVGQQVLLGCCCSRAGGRKTGLLGAPTPGTACASPGDSGAVQSSGGRQ